MFIIFFPLISIIRKLQDVCEYYTYQMIALLPGIFIVWFGVVYEPRLASYSHETVSKDTLRARSRAYTSLLLM